MQNYKSADIRNVCLIGHSSDGKTSLAESMLFLSKATDRLGKISDKNTVCDYDDEELKRGFSISSSLALIEWKKTKINMIDTPGYLDFVGEVKQALRVAGSAIIVVDAKAGIEVGTELAWDYASHAELPRAFFINKCDDPEARFSRVFHSMREQFGISVCPVLIPMLEDNKIVGLLNLTNMEARIFQADKEVPGEIPESFREKAEEYRNMFLESIAETDETLMEKFFAEEEMTKEEIDRALHDGILSHSIIPVLCGSASKLWGVSAALDIIVDSFPSPVHRAAETVMDGDAKKSIAMQEDGEPSIFVYKTVSDPFVGKMSFFKVMSGTLQKDALLKNLSTGQTEKIARIYCMRGKKQIEVDSLPCGDLGMTAKLANTNTNDTLSAAESALPYKKIKYPESFMQMSIEPLSKGDEDKISTGINRLLEEDMTLRYENNPETKQMLIAGQGDIHLDVVVSKLKNRFGTSVALHQPKIAYRETIKKTVSVEGKHKKQSGGSGQYGHVKITFSPGEEEGLTFTQSVVGGTVPKGYYPAVEKGLLEAMQKGVLAGYPVVHLKADLFDGSYHPVDSNEISFKLAARLAYKEGLPKANPVILEPYGKLCVWVPDAQLGDIMGGISKSRGRVLGMTPTEKKGEQMVEAEVPLAEMSDYTVTLRALTQGRGRFTLYFDHYEEVPAEIAQKIIEESRAQAEE
ncbi:MAG: elongation factor G [Eubacteriales bacterium]|nr:elongation factor G [Eubacteriales bacterium]